MTLNPETASARQEPRACAYNLFRNKEQAELFCAVPEDRPVPGFVVAEVWTFERILQPRDVAPPGFHDRGARAGVRYNGFYLFQATTLIGPINSSVQEVGATTGPT